MHETGVGVSKFLTNLFGDQPGNCWTLYANHLPSGETCGSPTWSTLRSSSIINGVCAPMHKNASSVRKTEKTMRFTLNFL